MTVAAIVAGAILIGAILQRLCGTGVGLVVGPVLALALGPALGILVTNATTIMSGFLIMVAVRRDVQWRHAAAIVAWAAPGALLGAWLVRELPAAWLQIIIGATVLVGLTITSRMPRLPQARGGGLTAALSLVGGMFNTTAGIAAPAMIVYAQVTRWPQRPFAATMQPVFMAMGAMSVAFKTLLASTGTAGFPPWWVFPAIAVLVVAGIRVGSWLSRRVTPARARDVATALAIAGGAAAVLKGFTALV